MTSAGSGWNAQIEPFDVEDYDEGVAIPDIGISPEPPYVVAVINSTVKPCTFYLSLSHPCFDVNGKHLQMGWTRDEQVIGSICKWVAG